MKYKKIMFMLVLAVFLLSIAGVCASDTNDTAMVSQDSTTGELTQIDENDGISSADESQVVGQTDNPEIIRANEKGTFTELKNEIQNGYNSNITLGRDYEYDGSGIDAIQITQSITIDGNGSTIDAKGEALIFDIRGGNVVIKNITFKNAHIPNVLPGAIRLDGVNFTISDCVFSGNSAYSSGGAIFALGSTCTISNCVFSRNTVSYGGGGAIFSQGSNCTIRGCVFEDNSAERGGAIYGAGSNIISDCVFVNNRGTGSNGDVIFYANGYSNISGCYFAENRADRGIISLSSGQNTAINDNIFLNNNGDLIYIQNQASSSNTDYNWFGNNATNYDDNPNVPGCNVWLFLDATHPDVATISDKSNITFKLYAYDSNGVSEYDNDCLKAVNLTLTPTNGNVNTTRVNLGKPVQFTAESPGTSELTATIKKVTYTISLPISDGTTFYDLNITINGNNNDTIVLDRDYTYNSTVDYNLNGGIVINSPVTIIGNGHTLNASGLARIFNVQADNVTVNNITFTNAKNEREGGAICWSGANGNLSDCNFVNNTVRIYGGAIYWNGTSGGIVSDCNFVNNSAYSYYGGAIYWDAGSNGIVSGCNFVNNSADKYGGAIFSDSCTGCLVSDCSFVNNSATTYGGAIDWFFSHECAVSDCSFENNNVRNGYGGAVFWRSADGVVSDCSFVNNSANKGSAIYYWYNSAESVVSGCVFVNNIADNGTIYFRNEEGEKLSINDNIFLNTGGAVIYFDNNDSNSNADYNWFGNNATNYDIAPITSSMEINTWLFLNATTNPDVIPLLGSSDIVFKLYAYNSSGVSEYDNGRLKEINLTLNPTNGKVNTTRVELGEPVRYTAEGAGIGTLTASIENVAYTITLKIIEGTFFELNRTINGNDNDTIILDKDFTYNSTFDGDFTDGIVINRPVTIVGNDHTLNASGLAKIFHIQADNVTIQNITFTNAYSSGYGGAIFWEGADGNVSGCLFANNSAAVGGAIEFYGSAGSMVSDCIFMNNSADMYGGAVYWNSADGVVTDCSFVNNSANNGGAVYWNSIDGVVCDCSFVNNSAVRDGSAIYWEKDNGNVSGCIFVNNSADRGTIYFNNQYSGQNFTINDNIFLNNDGVAIYFVRSDSASNADYNWFGNNATNYDIVPVTTNVEINTWLFLNATADPNPVETIELSDVSFKLYSYNATGIFDYDNSRLQPVNLTLTATNGDVDSIAKLGETVKYNATSLGTGSVTAKIENVEYTIELNIIKSDPILSVESNEVTYGNNTIIALDYNSIATGKVNITLKGKKYDYIFADRDLNATISLGIVGADEYDVIVEYSGDDIFTNAAANGTLKVNKSDDGFFRLSNDVIGYGENATIRVTAPVNAYGNITYTVYQNEKVVYTIKQSCLEDLVVPNLKLGTYIVTGTFEGDDYYTNKSKVNSSAITVIKGEPTIDIDLENITGSTPSITVKLPEDATGNVSIYINGELKQIVNVVNGSAVVNVTGLKPGNNTVTVVYSGDGNYSSVNKSAVVKNNASIISSDMTRGYNSGLDYTATLFDAEGSPLANAKVTVKVDTNTYTVQTDSNGVLRLNNKLAVGNHAIVIINPVTGEYKLNNLKIAARITGNKNVKIFFADNSKYTVRIVGDDGNYVGAGEVVKMNVGGKTYSVKTDKNGYATLKLSLKVKKHTITITYKGFTTKNTVTVKSVVKPLKKLVKLNKKSKSKSKKTAKAKKKSKYLKIKVKLKGKKVLKKKRVYMKFKGKTYKAKTNKKGIATFKVPKKVTKKLKKGKKYKATFTYKVKANGKTIKNTAKCYVKRYR